MKTNTLFLAASFLAVAGLMACQKEYSNETGGIVNPPATGGLLIGIVRKDADTESRFTYQYNANNQILDNLIKISSASFSGEKNVLASRDAFGKILGSMVVSKTSLNPTGDTISIDVKRNATGNIAYTIIRGTDPGDGYDSLVYNFTSNKLTAILNYFVEPASGSAEPIQKFEFTYAGDNVVKSIEYELPGTLTGQRQVETITLEYDTAPAAQPLGVDEYIVGLIPANLLFPCVNNVTKYERENEDDASKNSVNTYKYSYGTNGKPVSAEMSTSRDGLPLVKTTLNFSYR